jgi:hypothetical protein
MKFLETFDTISEIRSLLDTGDPVRAAVSYWGDGAVDSLGITKGRDLIVVCDVLSGGCNPAEVRKLMGVLGSDRVLTYDRLHTKVWLASGSAIVGSSNASSNGLGFEGEEAAALVEANLVLDAPDVLAQMQKWWAETIHARARAITEADLRRAQKLWKRQRVTRPPPSRHADLLSALRAEPLSFKDKNLFVWVWDFGEVDRWFGKAREQVKEEFGNDIECWQDVESPPSPGSFVLEFNSTSNPPTLDGLYCILGPSIHKNGTLLLCRPVQDFEGMPLGRVRLWRAAAKAAVDAGDGDTWEANDFARFLSPSRS